MVGWLMLTVHVCCGVFCFKRCLHSLPINRLRPKAKKDPTESEVAKRKILSLPVFSSLLSRLESLFTSYCIPGILIITKKKLEQNFCVLLCTCISTWFQSLQFCLCWSFNLETVVFWRVVIPPSSVPTPYINVDQFLLRTLLAKVS